MPSAAPVMPAPAGRVSAPVPAYIRSSDESPSRTAYAKESEAVPDPDAYAAMACGLPPASSASTGVPETATGRVKLIAMSTVDPAAYVPFGADTDATDGGIPSEARTARSGASGLDGTAYTVAPASPAAGGASARLAMPPPAPDAPPSTGTVAIRRSSEASYTRTDPPDAAYSTPVPASSARARGSATAVSTWYRNDGIRGRSAAAAAGALPLPLPLPDGGASRAYAESVPLLYSAYSFERAWSIARPAAVYEELSAARSGRRADTMLDARA